MIELLFTLPIPGSGSDGFHRPSDPPGIYYSISDRGPNVDCKDALDFLNKDICPDEKVGKIFLNPKFNPTIYKWAVVDGKGPKLLKEIPLRGPHGEVVNGMSNDAFVPEVPFDGAGKRLEFDAAGVDPEGLVVLADGSFIVSEEYGPSILKVDAGGRIQERWIPAGSQGFYQGLPYKVRPILPEIFGQRRSNRGFESLALSPDESHILVANQSALAWPDEAAAKASGVVRIMKLSLSGDVLAVSGYKMDEADTFEDGAKTSDLKVSAMLYHRGNLLVEERTDRSVKIYRVEKLGRDISRGKWMDLETSPSLESAENLPKMAKKTLVWNSLQDGGVELPSKIESMVHWDDDQLLLLNDDDFGVSGEKSAGLLLTLP